MDTIDNVGQYPIHSVTPTIKGQQSLHIKTFGVGVALILFVNLIRGHECKRKRSQYQILKQVQFPTIQKPVLFGYCCCIKTQYVEFNFKDIVDVQPVALQETVARSRVRDITRRRTYMLMQTYRVQFEFNDGEKYWPDMQLTQGEILQINKITKSYQQKMLYIRETQRDYRIRIHRVIIQTNNSQIINQLQQVYPNIQQTGMNVPNSFLSSVMKEVKEVDSVKDIDMQGSDKQHMAIIILPLFTTILTALFTAFVFILYAYNCNSTTTSNSNNNLNIHCSSNLRNICHNMNHSNSRNIWQVKESETPQTFGKRSVTKLDIFERLSGIPDDDNASGHEMVDIEDDFMNSIELRVQFDPITGRIFILEQNEPITEVKAQGFYSKSGMRLIGTQFQLTTLDEERTWLASINSDDEKMRMQLIQSSSSDPPIFRSQDDLVFLNNSKEDLQQQIPKILEILSDLGWKVSREKSILTPQQQIEFLGWKLNLNINQLTITKERRVETLSALDK
ncbi:MAG: hypothetical protein EZS28_013671 [Streblomastix strix]|uniref:Uncharacterized protein n=1 Tax=Streblomastix strix TaxID=222440 RepID=A0A5J4W887_9EUKA|nr:MAG: hypothetical protein EZS28_013671 [Streblomastix strix]